MSPFSKAALKVIIPVAGMAVSAVGIWIAGLKGVSLGAGEQLLLVLSGGTLTAVLELVILMADRGQILEQNLRTRLIIQRGEVELENIRTLFPQLVQNSYSADRDLYVEHFVRRFSELAKEVRHATETGTLRMVEAHAMSVHNVLAAFADDQEKVLRYVWRLEAGEHPFGDDPTWKVYFIRTVEMTRKRTLKGIRALLVIDYDVAVSDANLQNLLGFFRVTRAVECKLIAPTVYQKVCEDYGVPKKCFDFGVYGKLLYCGECYEPRIMGEFTKDEKMIKKYRELFDAMWECPDAQENPSNQKSSVDIKEIINDRKDNAVV